MQFIAELLPLSFRSAVQTSPCEFPPTEPSTISLLADVVQQEEETVTQTEETIVEEKPAPQTPLFEETLADYQPPKRYVKEERKETAKAPKVMIMVSAVPL